MSKTSSPRGIAALPTLGIVLLVAILIAGAVYLATRDQGNTNTVVTTNTTNTTGSNLNTVLENRNTPPVSNLNALTNTNSSPNANAASNANTNTLPAGWQEYVDSTYGFSLAFPPEWDGYFVTTYDHKYPVTNEDSEFSYVVFEHPKRVSDRGRPGQVGFTITYANDPSLRFPMGTTLLAEKDGVRYGFSRGNGATPDDLAVLWDQMDDIAATFAAL